jgi:putative tricarboxylic transport membrane protein
MASESANNATVGGGLIPTLVLGIPGTPPDAVILGALMVQGVRTGPTLFQSGGAIVYTFIWGLFLATILMLPTGLLIGRYAYKSIISVPKPVLVAAVALMTVVGTFAIRNNGDDVILMVALGGIGWVLARFGFAVSPIVLGLILGPIAEQGFVQAWTIGDATGNVPAMFFGRPISLGIIAFTILSLGWPAFRGWKDRRRGVVPAESGSAPPVERGPVDWGTVAISIILIAVAAAALNDARGYADIDSSVFPVTVSVALIVFSLATLVRALLGLRQRGEGESGSPSRRAALFVAMMAAALLLPYTGFVPTSVALAVVLVAAATHGRWSIRNLALNGAGCLVVIALIAWIFRSLLQVPLPTPQIF